CTSSTTPGTVWCSWRTPSIRKAHTAAPRSDERRTRRTVLPNVCPNPRSSGEMTNCAVRPSSDRRVTSTRCGNTNPVRSSSTAYLPGLRPAGRTRIRLDPCRLASSQAARALLGVELHDELLLDRQRYVRSARPLQHPTRARSLVDRQPAHRRRPTLRFERRLDRQ